MAVICDDCGREIEKHEPRHMYTKTVGRYGGAFGGGRVTKRVPICQECWQKRMERRHGCLIVLVIIAGIWVLWQLLGPYLQSAPGG